MISKFYFIFKLFIYLFILQQVKFLKLGYNAIYSVSIEKRLEKRKQNV